MATLLKTECSKSPNKVYRVEHTFEVSTFLYISTVKAVFEVYQGKIYLIGTEGFLVEAFTEEQVGLIFSYLLEKAGLLSNRWLPESDARLVYEGNSVYSFWDGVVRIHLSESNSK